MKRAIAVAIALACAACGGDSSNTPAPDAAQPRAATATRSGAVNEAPTIESAELTPDPASAADSLTVEVRALDPDRDRLTTAIEWFRNGEAIEGLHDVAAPSGTFNRGDSVYATVTVSDGTHEVTRLTPTISIGNATPRVRSVEIAPNPAIATDLLEAHADVEDADGDSVELSYRWYRNGVEIPAATSARLPAGIGHRGDKIGVEVSASDGTDASAWVGAPYVTYANAKPTITSQPGYEMGANGVYDYQIQAKDPDGDAPLRFELVHGPPGMTVDEASGAVTWTVPQDAKGNNSIEVAVSDSYGGRVTQDWVLSVDWNQPPAAPSDNSAAKPKAASAAKDESQAERESAGDEETPVKRAAPAPAAKKSPAKAEPPADEEDSTSPYPAEEPEEEEF
jgi:hypothetical protein